MTLIIACTITWVIILPTFLLYPCVPHVGVGDNGFSLLLAEPAILGVCLFRFDLFFEKMDITDPDLFFSLLKILARSEPVPLESRSESISMNALGKMPHLPLEFVPDQHQKT